MRYLVRCSERGPMCVGAGVHYADREGADVVAAGHRRFLGCTTEVDEIDDPRAGRAA